VPTLSRSEPPPGGVGSPGIPGPGLVNAANALTVVRLGLVPVFVSFLLAGEPAWRIAAFLTFGVASATDLLDGRIARRRGLITDFGKIADPIADKALIGSALVTLSALRQLPWWVTGLVLVRESGVTALRFWVIRHGVIPASRGGKLKTMLQVIAIGLYVLPGPIGLARPLAMAAAVAVTVITGADYVLRAMRLRRQSSVARAQRGEGNAAPGIGADRGDRGGSVGTAGADNQANPLGGNRATRQAGA
jgi:CDP-diacylglycerol--glycerol-3-phosphate 3-phosphatidyltransferase